MTKTAIRNNKPPGGICRIFRRTILAGLKPYPGTSRRKEYAAGTVRIRAGARLWTLSSNLWSWLFSSGSRLFFSGVETAFVSLSDIRIQHLMKKKKRGMGLVKELKDNNERLLITILIGNNLVNIAASSFATSIAITVLKSNALGIAVGDHDPHHPDFRGRSFPKTSLLTKTNGSPPGPPRPSGCSRLSCGR